MLIKTGDNTNESYHNPAYLSNLTVSLVCTIVGPLGTVISSELEALKRFVLVAFLRLRGSFDSSMVGRSGSRRGLLERLRRVGEAF